jgi:hypothetical protein
VHTTATCGVAINTSGGSGGSGSGGSGSIMATLDGGVGVVDNRLIAAASAAGITLWL